jgi:hypothetical protein
MDVKLATQVGAPYDAAAVASDVRTLWDLGRFSDVSAETVEDGDGVDVRYHVVLEPRYGLREIRFEPHPFGLEVSVAPGTLLTRADGAKLAAIARSQLVDRGWNDAKVDWRFQPAPHEQVDLMLTIDGGKQGKRKKEPPLPAAPRAMCACLFEERREAERKGILDFNVSLDESGVPVVERGRAYTLSRINFHGNHHYSDALIRSHFIIDEGVPLDLFLLRQSVVRLNRAGLFEPVNEKQVHIATDDKTGTAVVDIQLTERKRHAWNFSGPVPVAASITGKVISTYALSFHLLAFSTILKLATNKTVLPVVSAEMPFTPGQGWLSGFVFAPQIGPVGMALAYAGNQLRERLSPALMGIRAPDLAIMSGEHELACRYPKPRFSTIRIGGNLALKYATSFVALP